MKFLNVKLILTCKCEQASLFASESLDRRLTFSEWWAGRLHDLVCHNCRKVTRQLRWLHNAFASMPAEVRDRLQQRLTRLSIRARSRIVEQMQQES